MSVARLYHTARYLKPGQLANRLWRDMRRPRLLRGNALETVVVPKHAWRVYAAPSASLLADGRIFFLNEAGSPFEWEAADKSKLWLYNLHYFDGLLAEDAASLADMHRQMIERWLVDNPPFAGTGWEPYPLSLRIVNWIKWLLAGNEPPEGMLPSLVQQADALSALVEYHLLGNHILANATALVFAGTFFSGPRAAVWLALGLKLLQQQLAEQVLEDGGHFERSPMYHNIILMDVLDLIQLGQLYRGGDIARHVSSLRDTAGAMVDWLDGLLHPDGDIPFFNDTAFGITPQPRAILAYARALRVPQPLAVNPVQYFEESGYISVHGHEQVALLDVAPVGPDYIPGHAHADTLSFEWSLFGRRVLVNSGVSEYGVSAERLRQRGTAAHNTVVVNGENSSEVWRGFRVARRARPLGVQVDVAGDCTFVRASHTGYQRLRPKVTHTRQWRVLPGVLEVHDTLDGTFIEAVAYFHLHPSVSVSVEGERIVLHLPEGRRCELDVKGGRAVAEHSTWHPEFGVSQANQRLAIRFEGAKLETSLRY